MFFVWITLVFVIFEIKFITISTLEITLRKLLGYLRKKLSLVQSYGDYLH